ncbi:uncharacterized protein AKAME5_000252500 [Lates japonicus]|uniref:Uncharacterized protein n=1 Tax=Lates japonicus TaxID=270547 RepID=A0AAD3M6J9_LATJO|nr:uncharacterized protein AKAME5_000252500 [Lates japonicus]
MEASTISFIIRATYDVFLSPTIINGMVGTQPVPSAQVKKDPNTLLPNQKQENRDCKMQADLGQQLIFPHEIASTNLKLDLVLWSPSLKSVYIIELTVPWEN